MTDIINEEENSNQIPEEIEDIAVVDNGTTYESAESAIIAKEEADKAKLWAQESERQANLASGSADTAAQARDDAIAAKEYAEAAATDINVVAVGTDLRSTPSNIKTVASNITDVTTVAGVSSAVTTVAGISSDVTSVAGNATDISAVAANNTNITAVAGNATNINAVNANKTNIDAVAANNTNITAVAGDLTNINAVAADLTNINNASANAQLAKDWATKMDGMVASEDYSAKYYADQARQAASGAVDNKTITLNANNKHQTIGVINQNDTTTALKVWHGTQAEYDALATHDANTRYYTDGGLSVSLLDVIYPIGSIYITTNSSCPLQTLGVGTWELVGQDRVLQGAGVRGVVGTTLNESLPNITGEIGLNTGGRVSGCFKTITRSSSYNLSGTPVSNAEGIGFDTSLSSSTYQDNKPVQPDAYLVNIYRRIL